MRQPHEPPPPFSTTCSPQKVPAGTEIDSHPTASNSLRRSETGLQRLTRTAGRAASGTDIQVGPPAVCGVHRRPARRGHRNNGNGGEYALVIWPFSVHPTESSCCVM